MSEFKSLETKMKKMTQFFPVVGHKKSTQGDSGKMILENEREGSNQINSSQKSERSSQFRVESSDKSQNKSGRDSKEQSQKPSQ